MQAVVVGNTADMTRAEWVSARKNGIGGSDAAAILGLSEYRSPYSVWADKLDMLPEREDTEAMRQGRDLETYVAERFCDATGKRVRRRNAILRHKEYPFMLANIDREVIGEDAGLECKTTSVMNLKKFRDGEYPATYYAQCVHYMAVTGAKKWYLAVLVLNQGFHVFEIERDEDEIAALIQAEMDFWGLVESRTPPPIDGSDATKRAIDAANPHDDNAPPAILYGMEGLIAERERHKSAEKEARKSANEIDNKIRAAMGIATTGLMHGYEVRIETITRKSYVVKESTYTKMDIKEASEQ